MRALLYILLIFIGTSGCVKQTQTDSGENMSTMNASYRGVYTTSDRLALKHPFFAKRNSFYATIGLTEKGNYNFVYWINTTSKAVSFPCEDGQPKLIQEAMDDKGIWKPIEYWQLSTCGFSHMTCTIEPNHYSWATIIKYKGDFQTKLRVKYKIGDEIKYSPTFNGSINLTQFEVANQ